MKRIVYSILTLAFSLHLISTQAQDKNAIVLTIDGKGTTVEEFENIFKKNNRDSVITPKSLDEYMELFINFKLKVAEAKSMGLDTVDKFVKELAGYRTQLARPYLVDATLLDGLISEAYERMSEEIHGYHILVKCDANASPNDSLRAYQKIIQLRNKIINGADFKQVAKESSEDPSAKENAGDLGYFTAFQMVYPFESAAYQTPIGQVSMPVRTKYGFHLVKVVDRRPARGEIHVAHIMIRDKSDDANYAKNKINEVYQKIVSKEKTFEELAGAYSEDGSSAKKGGELPWFGINKMVTEFEDASFALKNNSDVSQPIKTSYGWHIIKRLDYKPVASFASMEKELKTKVQKDSRAEKTRNAFLAKLKVEYQYSETEATINKLIAVADTNVYKAKWAPKKSLGKKVICTIKGQKVFAKEFVEYINAKRPSKSKVSPHDYIHNELVIFCNEQVLKYEDQQLENKYPAFRLLMNEYRDGILLFELTDQKVWTKAVKDTSGLRTFYENNKYNYAWPDRAEIAVFTCENAEYSKKVRSMLSANEMEMQAIEVELNQDGKGHVELDGGTYSQEDRPLLAQFDWKKQSVNPTDLMVNGKPVVVKVKKFLPAGPKKLSEARGVITSDYQTYLEKSWIESLRKGHQIQINKEVLYTIH
jgi:peptidyl-prolyl cis-trans isomerase SurA